MPAKRVSVKPRTAVEPDG